jgi:hypothetical protein
MLKFFTIYWPHIALASAFFVAIILMIKRAVECSDGDDEQQAPEAETDRRADSFPKLGEW